MADIKKENLEAEEKEAKELNDDELESTQGGVGPVWGRSEIYRRADERRK